ncbi:hypothetical protein RJI07_04795 [Mycoplasmatota bacterium WC30]
MGKQTEKLHVIMNDVSPLTTCIIILDYPNEYSEVITSEELTELSNKDNIFVTDKRT